MTADFARKLGSSNPRERLEAARHLAENAEPHQAQIIESALAVVTVMWVANALRRALQRARLGKPRAASLKRADPSSDHISSDQTAQIYSDALEATAKQIIHEIEPILGGLRLSAETEVSNFAGSDTKRGLDRMEALVAGLAQLRRAASAPRLEEFSLAQCINDWIVDETGSRPVNILRAGLQECNVKGDRGLVCLSFTNGLRNAIDATLALTLQETQRYPDIVVSWGVTNIDVWIAIIDGGVGFRGNIVRAFEIGSTTKSGHLGMGLATAQQAMTSMGGSVSLIPADHGVRFEMRWPRAHD